MWQSDRRSVLINGYVGNKLCECEILKMGKLLLYQNGLLYLTEASSSSAYITVFY